MIIDLPLSLDNEAKTPRRPIRMGLFHFSNNNLSIRRQCAREIGMYDLGAAKSEDVDLCFRVALSRRWVAWREDGVVVRHKGRATLGGLLRQMWGWGFHLGYPYAKTGRRGIYLYWLRARDHQLGGAWELSGWPILACVFGTDFHLASGLLVAVLVAACTGHLTAAAAAMGALLWATSSYLSDVVQAGLKPWHTLKLAVVHYLTDLTFTVATFAGGLRHRVILIPSSVIAPPVRTRRGACARDP